jgi:flagellar biosynthetic protein FlhB
MAFEDAERTEAATPKRRQEARERGEVVRSVEVTSALILLATFGALAVGGAISGQVLLGTVRDGLQLGGRTDLDIEAVRGLLVRAAWAFAQAAAPVAIAGAVVGLLGNLVQVGFLVTPKAIEWRWERLNPVRGLQSFCSTRGAVEAVKATLKLLILGSVAYRTLEPEWGRLPALAHMDLLAVVEWELGVGLTLAFRVIGVFCLLAAADYGYQWWRHEKGLRMNRSEIQEEGKQQEGNPQVRSRVRSLQQERSMRRMMDAVPSASVVVVNPTHIAVALQYDGRRMRAPRVVAKGQRLIAERIVALARAAGVPVVQDIPLARALFKLVEVEAEVPMAFYRAVAKILAYVYAEDAQRRGRVRA